MPPTVRCLRVVAAGEGESAPAALGRIEARQRIECATKLEGTSALQVLALEENIGAQFLVGGLGAHHGSPVGKAFNPARGR